MYVNISNVFAIHDAPGEARYPEYVSKLKSEIIMELRVWNELYVWRNIFGRFMGDISKKHYVQHFCRRCLGNFNSEAILQEQSKWWIGEGNIYSMLEE